MGQKVNPNIFQLGINKEWNVKFSETTNEEHTLYNYHNIEIKNFLQKFFKDFGLNTHLVKFGYTQKYLYVYISYYFTNESIGSYIKKNPNKMRTKRKSYNTFRTNKISNANFKRIIKRKPQIEITKHLIITRLIKYHLKLKNNRVLKNFLHSGDKIINFLNEKKETNRSEARELFLKGQKISKIFTTLKILQRKKKFFITFFNFYKQTKFKKFRHKLKYKDYHKKFKYFSSNEVIFQNLLVGMTKNSSLNKTQYVKKLLKPHRYFKLKKIVKLGKNLVYLKRKTEINNNFLKKLLKTLTLFTNNKFHIKLILQHVNKGKTKKLSKNNRFKLRKKIILLRQYSRQDFFKPGISTIITFLIVNSSKVILAEYIAKYIKKLKRHNFFFIFLKRMLNHFIILDFCKIKGIKINIKGRFNGRPRARTRSILAGDIAVQSFNKKVEYFQKTVYTKNGTFGIEIWVNC